MNFGLFYSLLYPYRLEECLVHNIFIEWMNDSYDLRLIIWGCIRELFTLTNFIMLWNLKKTPNVSIGQLLVESNHSTCVNKSMCKVYSYVRTTWVSSATSCISLNPTARRANCKIAWGLKPMMRILLCRLITSPLKSSFIKASTI